MSSARFFFYAFEIVSLTRARTHPDSGFIKTYIRHLKVNQFISVVVVSFIQCFSLYCSFVEVRRTANTTKIKTEAYEPEPATINGKRQKPVVFICVQREQRRRECSVSGILFLLLDRRPDIIIIVIVRKALSIVPPLFHYHFT